MGRCICDSSERRMAEQNHHHGLNDDAGAPRLWSWPTYLSIAIAMGILASAAAMVDMRQIWHQIAACDKRFVILGALAHYATYLFRGMRWRRCLAHLPVATGNGKFALMVFFYNFVDNLVPAKLGDIYAAHLARINFRIRRSTALGSIVFLRMIDAWFILVLASMASWILFSSRLPKAVIWSLIGGAMIAVGATSIMLAFVLFKKKLPGWIPQKIKQMIQAFQSAMWPGAGQLVPIGILTVLIWVLETLWIFFLLLAFDLQLSLAKAVFLTMIPLLASAFPITPSGAGVVEITLYSCLKVVGVASPVAGSLTVINRLVDYWLHIVLGVLTWALRHVLGLRTWRDISLKNFSGSDSGTIAVDGNIIHDN